MKCASSHFDDFFLFYNITSKDTTKFVVGLYIMEWDLVTLKIGGL
jgi:hypothetical protein